MTSPSELSTLSRAVEALGDRLAHPREPVFFDEKVSACLANVDPHAGLDLARKLIEEATIDKEFGHGPPLSDLNAARRKWNAAYETLYPRKDVAA